MKLEPGFTCFTNLQNPACAMNTCKAGVFSFHCSAMRSPTRCTRTRPAWWIPGLAHGPSPTMHLVRRHSIRLRRLKFASATGSACSMGYPIWRLTPGIRMQRKGMVRHCQGVVLADWMAVGSDGKERMTGTNVFVFRADGRIDSVTGFTDPPRA